MTQAADPNPRKPFDAAVRYAIQVSDVYLHQLRVRGIAPSGLRYFEIGPGADFAPQLVLASYGAEVTVADEYLADWDPSYHPEFYRAFLQQWRGGGRCGQSRHRQLRL